MTSGSRLAHLRQLHAHRDRGAGDDSGVVTGLIGDVEPALDHPHRDLAVRQGRLDRGGVNPLRLLCADRDLDLHLLRVEAKAADERQRRMMQRVLHRADRRLGVVAAVQIVAAAHFEDDAFCRHDRAPQGMSSRTTAAAWASTIESVPASLGISSPPSTRLTVPVPCGSTASTCALSTFSGCGTPMVTSTCIESTGSPTASAMESELCQSASRKALTAALV